MVLGLDDAVGRAAFAGDVEVDEFSFIIFHVCGVFGSEERRVTGCAGKSVGIKHTWRRAWAGVGTC